MEHFYFTKSDKELSGGRNVRDPLGFQVLWSALGRRIIPHLTEQTNVVEGFQLLISTFYLHEKFRDFLNSKFDDVKPQLGKKSVNETFSLQNFFLLTEQAFAYSYYAVEGKWNLPGQRQVTAFREDPILSFRRQILGSQLANGVWGLYRGAASRAGLLDASGFRLTSTARDSMQSELRYQDAGWRKYFRRISDGLIEGEVEFKTHLNSSEVQLLHSVLESMWDKRLLRMALLSPNNSTLTRPLAELALETFRKEQKDQRVFLKRCMKTFSGWQSDFENILRCEDYIGPLEAVIEWLLNYNGLNLKTVARELPIDLSEIEDSRKSFQSINTFTVGPLLNRATKYVSQIDTSSKMALVQSLLDVHKAVAEERGSLRWVMLDDAGRIACEIEPRWLDKKALQMTPGKGWRNDYYLTPLVNIYQGLK